MEKKIPKNINKINFIEVLFETAVAEKIKLKTIIGKINKRASIKQELAVKKNRTVARSRILPRKKAERMLITNWEGSDLKGRKKDSIILNCTIFYYFC